MRTTSPFLPPFDFREHVLGPWGPELIGDTASAVLMGTLVAVACGWLGCYLILQGMSLIGDAISHAVLLGIVVAFLLTGQTSGLAVFLGAAITGLLTTLLIELLHTSSRIKEDAAIGIVFTSLFALGVVLLSTFARMAHVDTQHVLFGNIAYALDEKVSIGGYAIPVAICQMAGVAAVLLTLIVLFYKELLLVSFDPQLAAVMGLRPRVFRYGLMALLSITVVNAFSAVGAILVVAMLIAPAATAFLLTRRLPAMFVVSTLVAAVSSLAGFHAAYWLDAELGGAIVCTACGLFGLAFLFSPQSGLVATAFRRLRLRWRMHEENVVRALLRLSGHDPRAAVDADQVRRALDVSPSMLRWTLLLLRRRGWIGDVAGTPGGVHLTEQGAAEARRLDRAHRLWETYLVDQVGVASDHVHPMAEEVEHLLSEQLVENVDDALGHPAVDPHGSPIPRSPIADQGRATFALSKLRIGDRGRVAGIAEPASMAKTDAHLATPVRDPAAEIASLGLPLGQPFVIVDRDASAPSWTIEFPDGRRIDLSHSLADALLVHADMEP